MSDKLCNCKTYMYNGQITHQVFCPLYWHSIKDEGQLYLVARYAPGQSVPLLSLKTLNAPVPVGKGLIKAIISVKKEEL